MTVESYFVCQQCGQAISTFVTMIFKGLIPCTNHGFYHFHPAYDYKIPEAEKAVFVVWALNTHVGPFVMMRTYDPKRVVRIKR